MNEPQNPEHSHGAEGESHPYHRKHKHAKHGAHGGAWKVAYADFVTAMLALFIVLWVLGQNDKVKEAVQAYFRDPSGYMKVGGAPFTVGKGATLSMEQGALKQAIERKLEEEIQQLQDALLASETMRQFSEQVIFELTDEGIRMEFRDAPKFSFFKIGSADVSPQLEDILKVLTPEIVRFDYPVAIEGHTDRRPYGRENYSNWELSADRGNAVRRTMLKSGLELDRISEVRAYADTRPLRPQDPFAVENRRVSILLKNSFLHSLKSEQVPDPISKGN